MQIFLKNHNEQAKKRLVNNPVPICTSLHSWAGLERIGGSQLCQTFLLSFLTPVLTEKLAHATRFGVSLFFNL